MGFRRARTAGAAALVAALVMVLAGSGHREVAASPPSSQQSRQAQRGRPGRTAATQRAGTAASRAAASRAAAGKTAAARVAAIVASMSLPEKVGQLLVPTVPGAAAADGGGALVREYHVGGVIYFSGNIQTARQVATLSAQLQQAAASQRPAIPLLIGTDQEGGIVSRLAGVGTLFPGQMAAGATMSVAGIFAQERVTGTELRALGINLDYAPVADVNVDPANPVIGIRSFGSQPALVSAMTEAAVAGFHAAGEAATAKHFPGHGDTDTDSHTGLPVIHHTLAQWWRIDAPPFQAAIRAGVDEIMIGHIEVPALDDSGLPASLSRAIVTGFLRDRLGYQGVVTTDSLEMGGALAGHSDAQVAVLAVQAGCDQVLMPDSVPVAYGAILGAVRAGRISMAQLDASVTRIISLKVARGLLPLRPAAPAAGLDVNTPAENAVAQEIANDSVTLVRDRTLTASVAGVAGEARLVLPLARGQKVFVADPAGSGLAAALGAALGGGIVASPGLADVIVVATLDATDDSAQQHLVAGLEASGKPVVVIAMGDPYDLGLFPAAAAAIATYSDTRASVAATAAVLAGRRHPAGRLPVAIPAPPGGIAYPYGTGFSY
jgi:beta-glucosidase-like glycosyl hydrolase